VKNFLGIAMTCLLLLPSSAWAVLDVDAGPDVTLECESDGSTEYTLNGTVPEEEGLTFEWSTENDVELSDDDTLTPTGTFPLGDTIVGLSATTETDSGDDTATITVEDSTPPVVRVRTEPSYLWPPNHKMREVRVRVRIRDNCVSTDDFDVELVRVRSNEPDNGTGDGNTDNDIQEADSGTDDRRVLLRAERKGNGNGRVYTLTYRVTDGGGNETEAEATVRVPHDARDIQRPDDDDDAEIQPICTGPREAAEDYLDLKPSPDEFDSARSCVNACRVWSQGCKEVIRDARQCVRSEIKDRLSLDRRSCREDNDRAGYRSCMKDLRSEQRYIRNRVRSDDKLGRGICMDAARDCAESCTDYAYIQPIDE